MQIVEHIAKHIREIYLGGNWTAVNLKSTLSDITFEEALIKLNDCNSIAILVNHIHYYLIEVTKVFNGNPLLAKDELSFTHPQISNQEDWMHIQEQLWRDVEIFANHIETLSDSVLSKDFTDIKYGSYYRNLNGIIEHAHYHLGQIVLIKKLIRSKF